jgi:hypothetical protein
MRTETLLCITDSGSASLRSRLPPSDQKEMITREEAKLVTLGAG